MAQLGAPCFAQPSCPLWHRGTLGTHGFTVTFLVQSLKYVVASCWHSVMP